MSIHRKSRAIALLSSAVFGLALAIPAQADLYKVSWDLGPLSLYTAADPSGLLYLDMQLTDGSVSGDGNSMVTIESLYLHDGTFQPPLPDIGNVAIQSNGAVVLKDGPGPANAVADHTVGFNANASDARLTFYFTSSAASFDSPVPDYFNVALLQPDLSNVPTTGLDQTEFLGYELTNDPANAPQIYAVDPQFALQSLLSGDPRWFLLASPTVQPAQALPSPASCAVFVLGLLAARRRRGKA